MENENGSGVIESGDSELNATSISGSVSENEPQDCLNDISTKIPSDDSAVKEPELTLGAKCPDDGEGGNNTSAEKEVDCVKEMKSPLVYNEGGKDNSLDKDEMFSKSNEDKSGSPVLKEEDDSLALSNQDESSDVKNSPELHNLSTSEKDTSSDVVHDQELDTVTPQESLSIEKVISDIQPEEATSSTVGPSGDREDVTASEKDTSSDVVHDQELDTVTPQESLSIEKVISDIPPGEATSSTVGPSGDREDVTASEKDTSSDVVHDQELDTVTPQESLSIEKITTDIQPGEATSSPVGPSGDREDIASEKNTSSGAVHEQELDTVAPQESLSIEKVITDIQPGEATPSPVGPSEDREDISEEELDLTSESIAPESNSAQHVSQLKSEESKSDGVEESLENKDELISSHQGLTGEFKLDGVAKSDVINYADDTSRQSKVPSEDLEAVSDDELPDASHANVISKSIIEGGEDVSSDEDEAADSKAFMTSHQLGAQVTNYVDNTNQTQKLSSDQDHEPVSPTALPESPAEVSKSISHSAFPEPVSPTALAEPVSPTALSPVSPTNFPEPISPTALPDPMSPVAGEPVSPTNLPEPVSPTALPGPSPDVGMADPVSPTALPELAPLDAEPISDEEEDNTELGEDEDGEAGEIKSPTEDITSPPSSPEQNGAILGEVEPVSADESPDTDGEIPSGDEEDATVANSDKSRTDANFEAIDSDEDGEVGQGKTYNQNKKSEKSDQKNSHGYMESISDEENLDAGLNKSTEISSKDTSRGASPSISETQGTLYKNKDSELGRVIPTSNFNEHQVELDYNEENDGDDSETKLEEYKVESSEKEAGEDGELNEGGGSDKDEGELSDDDCEEGEIKEPGSRKPFIKPMCRFFQRGNCTWGVNCRFLHPGVNDKGNYQMIEIPGFQPPSSVHSRLGVPGPWPEQPPPEQQIEIPPPPMPDTPPPETAWERGLRIAKEQRKNARQRKEQEPDFEEKRLNLSVDEERELNKENERTSRIIPKDPYYDQQAYEEDEYYKIPRDPWHTGHYENFEVRYHREPSYSPPPYRERPPGPMPPARYNRHYSPQPPPVDKFGRDRTERREEYRPKPAPPPAAIPNDYPSPPKRPDEWIDPWRRQTVRKSSKSPQRSKRRRSGSRSRRNRRSVSDSSNSSRSGSGSSSGSSRSSRSYSGSSGSSSRSRSPEPGPPGVDRNERYNQSPSRDQPRSAVSVRGRGGGGGGYQNYNQGPRRDQFGRQRDGGSGRGDGGGYPHRGGFRGDGQGPGGHFNYGRGRGGGDTFNNRRDNRDKGGRDGGMGRGRMHSPPGRPLPYTRPRPRSASSHSSSSGSRSRSGSRSGSRSRSHSRGRGGGPGGRGRYSSSRSSSGSSSSRSSSSSSAASADSEHLYRDLGSPGKSPSASKRKRGAPGSHKDKSAAPPGGKAPSGAPPPPTQRHSGAPSSNQLASRHPVNLDHIPIPRDPRDSRDQRGESTRARDSREARDSRDNRDSRSSRDPNISGLSAVSGRSEGRYASRNAPQAPVKAKDPLKVVGQKSNIKLTLLPKQQQPTLGGRPNPLDSPPHKRRASDRDSPPSAPPAKRLSIPVPQSNNAALRVATEKAAKIQQRQEKGRQSPPSSTPSSSSLHHAAVASGSNGGQPQLPTTSSSSSRARAPISPQKQPSIVKSRGPEPSVAKTAPKMPVPGGATQSAAAGAGATATGASSSGASAGKAKKSMSSRREELLKQLKAVEDAIARKKTKIN